MFLERLGWDDYFERQFDLLNDSELKPARIILKQKNIYHIIYGDIILNARLSGKYQYNAVLNRDFPCIGDWVAVRIFGNEVIIHSLLKRKNCFARKQPISGGRKIKNGMIVGGSIEEQIVASNIDFAFIVCGLDENFNTGRIERYLTLACSSRVEPVILLNKADLCSDTKLYLDKVHEIAPEVPVFAVSAAKSIGMEIFNNYMIPGKTIAFLGSSGVGKSSIINYLFGEERQRTGEVSLSNGKGRHTTTSKELFFHESGCMLIDTPGLRELQLWGEEDALYGSFQDIYDIAEGCRFSDCSHEKEPGCAVLKAVEEGTLSTERYENFKKQQGELQYLSKAKKQFDINMNRKMKRKGGM